MKNKFSVVISILSFLVIFSGCKKQTEEYIVPDVVEESEFFYSVDSLSLGESYLNSNQYDSVNIQVLSYGENSFISHILTSEYIGNNIVDTSILQKIDYSGEVLGELIVDNDLSISIEACFENDDNYYCICCDKYSETNEHYLYIADYNNNSFSEICEIEVSDSEYTPIYKAFSYNDSFVIAIENYDNSISKTKISSFNYFGENLYNIELSDFYSSIVKWDDGKLLCKSFFSGLCSVDLSSFEFQAVTIEASEGRDYALKGTIVDGGLVLFPQTNGFIAYDIDNMSEDTYIDFNFCDLSMYYLWNGVVEYCTEDRIVLRDCAIYMGDKIGKCELYVLNKNNDNPYRGREIIEIAQLWGINQITGEGIYAFNKSQENVYAYVTCRYNEDFVVPEMYGNDISFSDRAQLVINQLLIDIENNNGPDVVLGLGDISQCNRDNYLYDYNQLIENDSEFDENEYFNSIYAYENDDGLYQIPLEVSALCLMADGSKFEPDRIGFSYDDYISFYENNNHGIDPIAVNNTREQYLKFLFANNQELFEINGELNFESTAFREMAEYIKDNTFEEGIIDDSSSLNAKWIVMAGFYYDMQNPDFLNDDVNIFGAPSSDGRGAMLCVFNTVAIVSNTNNVDACWNLTKMFLSEDVQIFSSYNPVHKNAFMNYALYSMGIINSNNELFGLHGYDVAEEDISRYARMLDRIDHVYAIDSEIYSIVSEELTAYFNDDKSLDQVIEIINQRIQFVVNEREN